MKLSVTGLVILLLMSFTFGSGAIVLIDDYLTSSSPPILDEPISLGNNVRKAYKIRVNNQELDVVEFMSDRNDYCIAAISTVTAYGSQNVSISCLPGDN